MEIDTAPRQPTPTPWGRLLLLVAVFGPVSLFVLLPIGLGLDRYVMTGGSAAGGIDRGTIAFERVVPVSDLRIGDVVTYQVAGTDGDAMVTRRVVSTGPDGIWTEGDATATGPTSVRADASTMSRVELTVPWIGWAYLVLFHPQGWLLTAASAAVLVALTTCRVRRPSAVVRTSDHADLATANP
jgi:signal peptidase